MQPLQLLTYMMILCNIIVLAKRGILTENQKVRGKKAECKRKEGGGELGRSWIEFLKMILNQTCQQMLIKNNEMLAFEQKPNFLQFAKAVFDLKSIFFVWPTTFFWTLRSVQHIKLSSLSFNLTP